MATRTQLARLVPLTCALLQFSPKSSSNCGKEKSPATEPPRVELPKELSKDVIQLSCESKAKGGVCDVYVVGVVHRSKESIKQVQSIVKVLKPDTVFLELCENRFPMLIHEKYKAPTMEEMIALRKEKHSIFQILSIWFKAQCGSMLDISFPGAKFRSASTEAIKYGGKVVLGDRPQEWQKRRIVAVVGKGHLEGMKKNWKQPVKIEDIQDLLTVPPPNPTILVMKMLATAGIILVGVAIISTIYL